MRQTVLNQTVLALLYKPCWPAHLIKLSFMTVYTVKQTGLTCAGPQKCASVNVVLINMPKVVRLMSNIYDKGAGKTSHHNCNVAQNYCVSLVNLPSFMGLSKLSEQSKEKEIRLTCNENNLTDYNRQ